MPFDFRMDAETIKGCIEDYPPTDVMTSEFWTFSCCDFQIVVVTFNGCDDDLDANIVVHRLHM